MAEQSRRQHHWVCCRCNEADKPDENVQPAGRMRKTNETKLINALLESKSEVVKIGVDEHAVYVTVCVQEDGSLIQRARRMRAGELVSVVTKLVRAGKKVYSCKEAGPCGYGLHRDLEGVGALSYVVVAEVLSDGKKQKTDGLDAHALCDRLDRYVHGNTKAMHPIHVPSVAQEQARARARLRDQLLKSRQQWESRGRSLLLAQGHVVKGAWWRANNWRRLITDLPQWLVDQLEVMRKLLEPIDEEEKAGKKQLESDAPASLPKGVGQLSWVLLEREVCDWGRFANRGQVASYTGLCPSVHQSGKSCRHGSINRHGNPRVRRVLIEMVWRLVRWQPNYPPVAKLVEGIVRGAARRKIAVAAARRLAIDLWRLATTQTTPEKLGLIVPGSLLPSIR